MAIENLTTYTAVGSAGVFTLDTSAATFTAMRRDAVSYAYYDFGAGYFGNFDIDFEFEITAGTTIGLAVLCAVSNTLGTFEDQIVANDGIIANAYQNNGDLQIQMQDRSTGIFDAYADGGTTSNLLYCTFIRNGTALTLDIYSNSGRTSLVDTLSITCETGTKRYFYVLASRDQGTDPLISGYTQNFEIQFNSSSSSSSSTSLSSSSSSLSSSSTSSSSESTSSSSSSYSSNCAEDLLDIPSGAQPDSNRWTVEQNDGTFGAGTGTTLGYDGSAYVNNTLYETLYASRWNLPSTAEWDINISWVVNYEVSPNLDPELIALRISPLGDLSQWTQIERQKTSIIEYQLRSSVGGVLIDTTTTDVQGKFRIQRTATGIRYYYWNASLSRWEWNGNTSGVGGVIPYPGNDIVIQLYFSNGKSGNAFPTRYIDAEVFDFQVTSYTELSCYSSSSSSSSLSSSSSSSSLSSSSSSSSSSLSSSSSSSSLSSSSSSSSLSSSSKSSSSSSAGWQAARIRRRYKGTRFTNCGLSPEEYYGPVDVWATIEWLESTFIFSSSSSSVSSSSSSSTSFSSSSRSSSSSSISSVSSSSSSTSSSSSSTSSSSESSSSLSSSSSSSSSSVSSSSSSSSLSSSSSSSSSLSSSSSSSSLSSSSFSSTSSSSSSISSSSTSCFIGADDNFNIPVSGSAPPNVQRWEIQNGNLVVSGGQLIVNVDDVTNISKMNSRFHFFEGTNLDVQVDWIEIPGPNNSVSRWNIGMEVLQLGQQIGTRIYKRGYTTTITEEMVSGGVKVDDTNVTSTDTSGGFRITLSGGTEWQSYYRKAYTVGWIPIGGPYTIASDEGTRVWLYVNNTDSLPAVTGAFDNFAVNSGSWECPGSSSSSSVSSSSSSVSSSSSNSLSSSSLSSSSLSSSSLSSSSSSSSVSSSSESSSSSSVSISESISISSSSTSSP